MIGSSLVLSTFGPVRGGGAFPLVSARCCFFSERWSEASEAHAAQELRKPATFMKEVCNAYDG